MSLLFLRQRAEYPGRHAARHRIGRHVLRHNGTRRNDRAVLAAYGWRRDPGEEEIAARLLELYAGLAATEG